MAYQTGPMPTYTAAVHIQLPQTLAFRAALKGQLLELCDAANWENPGSPLLASAEEYAEIFQIIYDNITWYT